MTRELAGFPFWEFGFDEQGRPEPPEEQDAAVRGVADADLTDLFVFSHGWNNDRPTAERLYAGFFGQLQAVLDTAERRRPDARIGVAGVFWPAILWPDEVPDESEGGAAGMTSAVSPGEVPASLLKARVFTRTDQQVALDELHELLRQRPRSDAALQRFGERLRDLVGQHPSSAAPEDQLEQAGLGAEERDWREVFEQLQEGEPAGDDEGGAAGGLGDAFDRLWRGAKGALRVTSYWEMKDRAGTVGRQGLGPLIGRLHEARHNLKVHLIGHSFGARLVSYTLAGLPAPALAGASPVKSLLLIQGAFSHWAFADVLPFDNSRGGDLKGMAARVDGPLLTTHSLFDTAVGRAYPLASFIAGQDAARLEDRLKRWGAMGHEGTQGTKAAAAALGRVGTRYEMPTGKWLNLDGNSIIKNGGPPSGAHSDIIHPEIAWAALSAAGV